jgi:hypothetical protein
LLAGFLIQRISFYPGRILLALYLAAKAFGEAVEGAAQNARHREIFDQRSGGAVLHFTPYCLPHPRSHYVGENPQGRQIAGMPARSIGIMNSEDLGAAADQAA